MSVDYRLLDVRRGPRTWWVTIDRRKDRNSINSPLMVELRQVLEEAEGRDARALVLTGAGEEHFVGGADGVEMMRCDGERARELSARLQALLDRLEASPIVLVAAIDGLCVGAGLELAMACDLRVATLSSRIGLPEVEVGLIPAGGGTQRLPTLVGLARAMELILGGRLCEGAEAERLGLVNRAVPREALHGAVEALLRPILERPAYAVRLAKEAVRGGQRAAMREGLAFERERFAACFRHDFFPEHMRRQLREGALETSEDVGDLLPGARAS